MVDIESHHFNEEYNCFSKIKVDYRGSKALSFLILKEMMHDIGILKQVNKQFKESIDSLSPNPAFVIANYLNIFESSDCWWPETSSDCFIKDCEDCEKKSSFRNIYRISEFSYTSLDKPFYNENFDREQMWKYTNNVAMALSYYEFNNFMKFLYESQIEINNHIPKEWIDKDFIDVSSPFSKDNKFLGFVLKFIEIPRGKILLIKLFKLLIN
jgi:Asp-tRNA(Asn)/Glu-tRNA(Gln) amidotransferase A subunit family amidase